MYAATTKDEGNAADGRFSTACKDLTPFLMTPSLTRYKAWQHFDTLL
jgi:hypothetical protein